VFLSVYLLIEKMEGNFEMNKRQYEEYGVHIFFDIKTSIVIWNYIAKGELETNISFKSNKIKKII